MEVLINTNVVFEFLSESTARVKSLRGGTRSGKTFNTCIYWIAKYMQTTGRVLTIARQTMPALRASAMRDFFTILNELNLYDEKKHNKTSNEYELHGNLIEFVGVKESQRVRGRKRDDLFVNEVNETDLESFRQLAFRTTGEIVIDYNPSDMHSFVYDQIEARADCELFKTTYLDNPFLEKTIVDEIERLKDADPDYWKVYGLGEIANISNIIFTHWKTVNENLYPANKGETIYGLDFGYNNPTALIETKLYDGDLYWREMLYQTKLTTADLIEKLKEFPELTGGGLIVADSAEPKTIEEIQRAGFRIMAAYKDVKDTILRVKKYPLKIHEGSANLLREIKKYSWKTDKNGAVLDDVIKFDDHCFIAGTLVATINGDVPIESVKVGDLVLTRKGYKKVLASGATLANSDVMTVSFSNGKTLTGTPNHPVWTEERGFVNLDALRYNDYILTKDKLCKSLNLAQQKKWSVFGLTKSFTDAIRCLQTRLTECISNAESVTSKRDLIPCTETFGGISMAKFLQDSTFITKTVIQPITTLKISSAFPHPFITPNTARKSVFAQHRQNILSIWTILENLLKNGTLLKQGGNGTANTLNAVLPIANRLTRLVNYVISSLKRLTVQSTTNSVQINAGRQIAAQPALTTSNKAALNAETFSNQTNTENNLSALTNAPQSHDGARVSKIKNESVKQTVYNLTVDEAPEYFASGVLVHNCIDAGRYSTFQLSEPVISLPKRESVSYTY